LQNAADAEMSHRSYAGELQRIVEARTAGIQTLQDVTVFALAKLADSRDPETGEHLARMRYYSQELAEELSSEGPYSEQIDETFLEQMYRASPLHDIGKVGISDAILLKPDKLTEEEFERMKQHALIGADTLSQAARQSPGGGYLDMAAQIARHHHERFDGSGYPDGLAGEEIPLPARIVALADVFDALTSVRVYKDSYSVDTARRMIEQQSGRHFDPRVVEAFRARYDRFLPVAQRSALPEEISRRPSIELPRWRTGSERGLLVAPQEKKVLVVHDDPELRMMMLHWLTSVGFSVRTAGDVHEATREILAQCPDFLIIRRELPSNGEPGCLPAEATSDGARELCQWLRQQRLAKYVYTIVTTDQTKSPGVIQLLDSGADDFLNGHANREELVGRLRVACRIVALEQNLSCKAIYDPLTGIPTRSGIQRHLQTQWTRAVRRQLPLTCVIVELDEHQRINHEFGMEAGDAALKAVAAAMSMDADAMHFVCRNGDDRFLALLADETEQRGASWANRLRHQISREPITVGAAPLTATVCVGIAERTSGFAELEQLVEAAENALLAAKDRGPDSAFCYSRLAGDDPATPWRQPLVGFTAEDVIAAPVFAVAQTDSVASVVNRMRRSGETLAAVVDDAGRLVGVVSEEVFLSAADPTLRGDASIASVMIADEPGIAEHTCDIATPADDVYDVLCRRWAAELIVTDALRPAGTVSGDAMLRWMAARQSAANLGLLPPAPTGDDHSRLQVASGV
jgi:diguanylate cyclase (GGDEF)-like protein